jgi:hypothetical protein
MNAFAAALAALMADPNMAVDAIYTAATTDTQQPVRVIRSVPDRVGDAFGAAIQTDTDVIHVSAADVPDVRMGDIITIGSLVLTVELAERDALGTSFRCECRRG